MALAIFEDFVQKKKSLPMFKKMWVKNPTFWRFLKNTVCKLYDAFDMNLKLTFKVSIFHFPLQLITLNTPCPVGPAAHVRPVF